MHIDYLTDAFEEFGDADAMVWRNEPYSYDWLRSAVRRWSTTLSSESLAPGNVVSLEADFSPNAVALLLAMVDTGCIVVPLTASVDALKSEYRKIAQVEFTVKVAGVDAVDIRQTGFRAEHEFYEGLRSSGHPGLVLFSSGSTGKSKASVHDLVPLLEKFKVRRHAWRTITFLLFDHIGGFNTLLYTLFNGGCAITVEDRSPEGVCAAIERHRVEMLPTSPTFINLLLISGAHRYHDLSSLSLVTYGTEVMPQSTLDRLRECLPEVRLQQTYGLSEVGILRSKSKSSDSLWVKIGGEGFETRVVEGLLEIRAKSAMLGYLNAPSPFADDGWFKTGDEVEVDGEYFRFLGRKEEIINVGGEKVYPAEVEGVLFLIPGVEDAVVNAEPNAITGQMVTARVRLSSEESIRDFRKRMYAFCRTRLPPYKIPQKIVFADSDLHSGRFKKIRLKV